MGVKKAIIEILSADADLTTQVGKRIQPRESPQHATFPRITFHRLNTEYERQCLTNSSCRMVTETFEVACFSRSDLDAENTAAKVLAALPINGTFAGIDFVRIDPVNRADVTEFPIYENDLPVPADVLTVEFQYEEDC